MVPLQQGRRDQFLHYSADSSYLRKQRNRIMLSPQLSKQPFSVCLLDACFWEIELS